MSIWLSTATTFSNTVLTSVADVAGLQHLTRLSRCGLGSLGYTRSTNFAPNTVVARICASTLAGMYLIWSGSISQLELDRLLPPAIAATRPTCTPRNLTLALVSITRPGPVRGQRDRHDRFSVPVNSAYVNQIAAIDHTRISVRHPGCRPVSSLSAMCYPARLKLPDWP